jgi:hypothetical protein
MLADDIQVAALGNVIAYAVGGYIASNRAVYRPLVLPSTQRLTSVAVHCTTTGSGTFDLGIYDAAGTTRLQSMGSTSLAAGVNTWTLTTPLLIPGGELFWLGMSCSTNTATFIRQATPLVMLRPMGVTQEATAHPLPATATPVQVAGTFLPTFALRFVA